MAHLLFTARAGGKSVDLYKSLNVALHVGDDENFVGKNREVLRGLLSAPRLQFMEQMHGNAIYKVIPDQEVLPKADALVTNQKGIALVVMVADCLPILIDGGEAIAAVHVGRRGMVNGIIEKTILELENLGSKNLRAYLGPSICGKCYEVSEDMYYEIIRQFPNASAGYRRLDIRTESIHQLESSGVEVISYDICTLESENFYSYRRNPITGRQCGAIYL